MTGCFGTSLATRRSSSKARQGSLVDRITPKAASRSELTRRAQHNKARHSKAPPISGHLTRVRPGRASQRGESYRQKAQRGVTERKGRAPPAPKAGSFALFTLREAMPSTAAIDVEVEEIKGNKDMNTHKQQSIFTYTNMCTWNTYVF